MSEKNAVSQRQNTDFAAIFWLLGHWCCKLSTNEIPELIYLATRWQSGGSIRAHRAAVSTFYISAITVFKLMHHNCILITEITYGSPEIPAVRKLRQKSAGLMFFTSPFQYFQWQLLITTTTEWHCYIKMSRVVLIW